MRDYHVEAMNEVVLVYRPDLEGPTLTSLIADTIKKYVEEEREACAKVCDKAERVLSRHAAMRIRARGWKE